MFTSFRRQRGVSATSYRRERIRWQPRWLSHLSCCPSGYQRSSLVSQSSLQTKTKRDAKSHAIRDNSRNLHTSTDGPFAGSAFILSTVVPKVLPSMVKSFSPVLSQVSMLLGSFGFEDASRVLEPRELNKLLQPGAWMCDNVIKREERTI